MMLSGAVPLATVPSGNSLGALVMGLSHRKRRSGLASSLQAGFAGAYRGSWTAADQSTGAFTLSIFTNKSGELYATLALQVGDQTIVQQSQLQSRGGGKFSFLYVSTRRIIRVEGSLTAGQLTAAMFLAQRDGGMQAQLVGRVVSAPGTR